jgi:hypothetical protein
MTNFKCPICGTSDDKEVVLIGIDGTEEGNNIKAEQIHLECIDLRVVTLDAIEKDDILVQGFTRSL